MRDVVISRSGRTANIEYALFTPTSIFLTRAWRSVFSVRYVSRTRWSWLRYRRHLELVDLIVGVVCVTCRCSRGFLLPFSFSRRSLRPDRCISSRRGATKVHSYPRGGESRLIDDDSTRRVRGKSRSANLHESAKTQRNKSEWDRMNVRCAARTRGCRRFGRFKARLAERERERAREKDSREAAEKRVTRGRVVRSGGIEIASTGSRSRCDSGVITHRATLLLILWREQDGTRSSASRNTVAAFAASPMSGVLACTSENRESLPDESLFLSLSFSPPLSSWLHEPPESLLEESHR